jgi:cytochrome c-type biogenesis protein CcmE
MAFLWPKSRKTRARLTLFLVIAPVLLLAAGLALMAMRDGVMYFYTPSQALAAQVPPNKAMRLGGLVKSGSLVRHRDGRVEFEVVDLKDAMRVTYQGDLPDLFREGQGVVCEGKLDHQGLFKASQVLAKHDETYMPKEVTKALKAQGKWRAQAKTLNKGNAL